MCFDIEQPPEINAIQKRCGRNPRDDRRAERGTRGRLHLREGGHRHDGEGNIAPTGSRSPTGRAPPELHGCFTFMKLVRAAPGAVQVPTVMLHVPTPPTGADEEHARLHREAAEGGGDPRPREGLRREVRHRPPAGSTCAGRRSPRTTSSDAQSSKRRRRPSTATSGRLLHGPDLHRLRGTTRRSSITGCSGRDRGADREGPVRPVPDATCRRRTTRLWSRAAELDLVRDF